MPYSAPLPSPRMLGRLDLQTLVVGAPGDPVHPQWLAQSLARRLPRARLAMAPHKGLDPSEHDRAVQQLVGAAIIRPDARPPGPVSSGQLEDSSGQPGQAGA
jgi:hypothetical protein